jgi:hypothetical protein
MDWYPETYVMAGVGFLVLCFVMWWRYYRRRRW